MNLAASRLNFSNFWLSEKYGVSELYKGGAIIVVHVG